MGGARGRRIRGDDACLRALVSRGRQRFGSRSHNKILQQQVRLRSTPRPPGGAFFFDLRSFCRRRGPEQCCPSPPHPLEPPKQDRVETALTIMAGGKRGVSGLAVYGRLNLPSRRVVLFRARQSVRLRERSQRCLMLIVRLRSRARSSARQLPYTVQQGRDTSCSGRHRRSSEVGWHVRAVRVQASRGPQTDRPHEICLIRVSPSSDFKISHDRWPIEKTASGRDFKNDVGKNRKRLPWPYGAARHLSNSKWPGQLT